ncbi:MAG: HAD-IIIA family hydrolase [Candidatus Gastranaerophilales bacterium]|nr:HAD-IIIA family hydrolase [Candidatus Gastranaerophilales bacterium]
MGLDFQKIKLLALDVDGVLTDGSISYTNAGQEIKTFNVKDGQGIVMLTKLGIDVAIITARNSTIVQKRATDLGIQHVFQGVTDKLEKLEELRTTLNLTYNEIAYMGDDLPDIPILNVVGIKACPNDAILDVKKLCNFKSTKDGGKGAVRELTDQIYYPAKLRVDKKPIELKPM